VVGGTIFWGGGGAAMGFGNGVWQWWGQRCIRSSVGPVWVGRGAKEMSLARCEFSATWVGIISSMQHVVLVFGRVAKRCCKKKGVVVDDVHVLLGIWSRRCSCVTHDCAVYTACTVLSGVCFRFSSLE
jgi:hypothetical protein